MALDWETSIVAEIPNALRESSAQVLSIDAIISCDCIYNEALIPPFVDTCAQICRLPGRNPVNPPTVCVVAQQIRSHEIFEAWLLKFMTEFQVWRIPDEALNDRLRGNSGFVIYLGILKEG